MEPFVVLHGTRLIEIIVDVSIFIDLPQAKQAVLGRSIATVCAMSILGQREHNLLCFLVPQVRAVLVA